MPSNHALTEHKHVFHEAINDTNTTKDLNGTKELTLYVLMSDGLY